MHPGNLPPFMAFMNGQRGADGNGFDFSDFARRFAGQFGLGDNGKSKRTDENGNEYDFSPSVDVYDTPEAYIIHANLPGANREDIGVTWEAQRWAVVLAGVVTRGVDENLANRIAMDERDVGVFRRVVRLGDSSRPAHVDPDGITARMEQGVLMVTVPKVDEFVEVKKVDVQ